MTRTERFLKDHPWCCYCGGTTRAETVDHVPSKQMFSLKRRPRGIEVPACQSCNHATKNSEQVAALIGRIYPNGVTEAERQELRRIMRAVKNNCPGLLEEMAPAKRQMEDFRGSDIDLPNAGGVLNVSGPLVNYHIQIFGAKLSCALHYADTGNIVPKSGGVAVQWFTNADQIRGEIPDYYLALLGSGATLTQGKWNVGDQFFYSSAIVEPKGRVIYFAVFRRSFAVGGLVAHEVRWFEDAEDILVHRPLSPGGMKPTRFGTKVGHQHRF